MGRAAIYLGFKAAGIKQHLAYLEEQVTGYGQAECHNNEAHPRGKYAEF